MGTPTIVISILTKICLPWDANIAMVVGMIIARAVALASKKPSLYPLLPFVLMRNRSAVIVVRANLVWECNMKYTNELMNEMTFLQRLWYVKAATIPFIFLGGLILAAIYIR